MLADAIVNLQQILPLTSAFLLRQLQRSWCYFCGILTPDRSVCLESPFATSSSSLKSSAIVSSLPLSSCCKEVISCLTLVLSCFSSVLSDSIACSRTFAVTPSAAELALACCSAWHFRWITVFFLSRSTYCVFNHPNECTSLECMVEKIIKIGERSPSTSSPYAITPEAPFFSFWLEVSQPEFFLAVLSFKMYNQLNVNVSMFQKVAYCWLPP